MAATASAPPISDQGAPEPRSTSGWVRFPVELALIGVTLATIYQLDPLFIDNSYFGPLAIIAIVLHAVLALARRTRMNPLVGILAAIVVLPLTIGLMFYPETTVMGIPTGATFAAAQTDVIYGWQNFQSATPPTEVTSAYLVAASFAIWMVVVLSDWAAFRFWSPGEALLPSVSAVVFAAFLDRIPINVRGAFVYLLAALVFFLLHRVAERISSGTWLGRDIGRSFTQLLIGGSVIAALVAALVFALAPSVPGYNEAPMYPLFDPDGQSSQNQERTVANPLVDIKDRLQADPEVEVFTVRSDRPTYWRTTALGLFDGGQFRARATYESVKDDLPEGFAINIPESDLVPSVQEFSISGLSQEWLPAAYLPYKIDAGDVDVQFEPDSATLITAGSQVSSNGMRYRVESKNPVFTPANLQGTPGDSVDAMYSELPVDFDPAVAELAQQLTADAPTTYAKAIALQDYFQRTGNFVYSLEPKPGHSVTNISEFLERKSGYCEQFSTTYAAMARAVGIPSRVAVGFTQGEADPNDPLLFHVKNKHAHAWPEIYISGVGWVPFEPTPGRGMQGAEQYTMLPADQQDGQPQPTPTPIEQLSQPEVAAPQSQETVAPTPTPLTPEAQTAPPPDTSRSTTNLADRVWDLLLSNLRFFVVMGTVLALGLLGLLAIRQLKSQRYVLRRSEGSGLRLHQITAPDERITHAWRVATDAIAFDGPAVESTETNMEFLKRAEPISPIVALNISTLRKLATAVTASRFSSRPVTEETAAEAETWCAEIVTSCFDGHSILERWTWSLDPRPIVESWRRPGVDKVPTISESPGAPIVASVHTAIIPPPPSGPTAAQRVSEADTTGSKKSKEENAPAAV